jgi:hypothetical protein
MQEVPFQSELSPGYSVVLALRRLRRCWRSRWPGRRICCCATPALRFLAFIQDILLTRSIHPDPDPTLLRCTRKQVVIVLLSLAFNVRSAQTTFLDRVFRVMKLRDHHFSMRNLLFLCVVRCIMSGRCFMFSKQHFSPPREWSVFMRVTPTQRNCSEIHNHVLVTTPSAEPA